MHYKTHYAPCEKGRLWLGSAFVAIPGEPQYGLFSAVNLNTGKIAWQNKVEQPMMGGALSTAGGLTFTGEGNGNFNAYDSKTGKLLWQFNAGAGCNSAPMSFELGGEQFIARGLRRQLPVQFPAGRRRVCLRPAEGVHRRRGSVAAARGAPAESGRGRRRALPDTRICIPYKYPLTFLSDAFVVRYKEVTSRPVLSFANPGSLSAPRGAVGAVS